MILNVYFYHWLHKLAMSAVFNVSTDDLLKSSEIDDLSVKTELLEKQQQRILFRQQKQQQMIGCSLYGLAVYLLFFAFYFIGHFHFWDQVSNPSLFFAGLLISTAIVILICVKKLSNKSQTLNVLGSFSFLPHQAEVLHILQFFRVSKFHLPTFFLRN